MAYLQQIVEFINNYLDILSIQDESWNGLQFQGRNEVKTIVGAVDSSIDVFNKALEHNADMIITHHGHFWKSVNPSYVSWSKNRLDILHKNNISLYAAHLPLDCHNIVGNNAQLIKLLDAEIIAPFHFYKNKNIGWLGKLNKPQELNNIINILNEKLPTTCKVLDFGPKIISTIAVCSGSGGYNGFYEAVSLKADLYITGDAIDIYSTAKDIGQNVLFAGHNATERLGIKALLELLNKEFNIDTHFIDMPTGL